MVEPGTSPAFIQWRIHSWRAAVELASHMHGWLYRGHANEGWGLTTSLERTAKQYNCPEITLGEQEEEILNQFKRQAHQHIASPPGREENVEWLSLILDFTSSFYVGAFFAMEDAVGNAVVWAINRQHLDNHLMNLTDQPELADHDPTVRTSAVRAAERCIRPSTPRAMQELGDALNAERPQQWEPDPVIGAPNVLAVKPWRLNQRMIIQQGWFLFPTSLDASFQHNLCGALGVPGQELPAKTPKTNLTEIKELLSNPESNLAILKMVFPRDVHLDAMRDLQRMNITAATPFPGLDGFARSLRFSLRIFDDLAEAER